MDLNTLSAGGVYHRVAAVFVINYLKFLVFNHKQMTSLHIHTIRPEK